MGNLVTLGIQCFAASVTVVFQPRVASLDPFATFRWCRFQTELPSYTQSGLGIRNFAGALV
jgi:hypothetical protein